MRAFSVELILANVLLVAVIAPFATAQEGAPTEPSAPAYHTFFKEELLPTLIKVEKEQRDLVQSWLDLRVATKTLREMECAFGSKLRKEAQRALPRQTALVKRDLDSFQSKYDRLMQGYAKEYANLKNKEHKLVERMDYSRGETSALKRQEAELEALTAEMVIINAYMEVLQTMGRDLDELAKPFDEGGILKLSREGYATAIKDFPNIIEARRVVQDYVSDLEMVRKRQGTEDARPGDDRTLAMLEQALQKSTADLQRDVEKAKVPLARAIESLESKINRLDARLESYRERGRDGGKYQKERDGLGKELEEINDKVDLLDSLANNEAKTPAKKK